MKKRRFEKFIPKDDDTENIDLPYYDCAHPGCNERGIYPAPKSRNRLREYQYFCMEHIREFNSRWNFFEGWSAEQLNEQMAKDAGWDGPTWTPDQYSQMELRLREAMERLRGEPRSGTSAGSGTSERVRYISPEEQKKRDAFALFGISEATATLKEIKTKYRELVKKHHPDINKSPKAEERFKVIAEAYVLLKGLFTDKN